MKRDIKPGDAAKPRQRAQRNARRGRSSDAWGRAAEAQAAQWYRARGGDVLAERKRTAAGEIDLVVRIGDVLAIVEVRARRRLDSARAALSARDWPRLSGGAEICAAEYGCADIRIDLAAVSGDGSIDVIENAGLECPFD
ncbi:MAG: YraN family protein [Neomegalonema sp.]|nr:YraN family protein [Neomegalonema sp.]